MSFGRTFHIVERVSLSVRAEFNNVLIGRCCSVPLRDVSQPRYGARYRPTPTAPPIPRFKSGFGTINTLGTVSGERQGTLVARLVF